MQQCNQLVTNIQIRICLFREQNPYTCKRTYVEQVVNMNIVIKDHNINQINVKSSRDTFIGLYIVE